MAVVTREKAGLAGPNRPLGSAEIPQFYLPNSPKTGVYSPKVYGAARILFRDRKRKIDESRRVAYLAAIDPAAKTLDWDNAVPTGFMPEDLLHEPPASLSYLPLPAGAMQVKTFTRWAKNFDRWLARTQRLELPREEAASVPPSEEKDAAVQGEPDSSALGPKRGGVSVELVGIVWDLT